MAGVECSCLLDTGSQVTTVTTSFYNSHLSEHPIQPIDGLDVEGASGAIVPYLGYIPLVLKFPKDFVETEPEVATLALVVPDIRTNCELPVLIGTNTLDVIYDEHCHEKNQNDLSPVYGFRQILNTLKLRKEVNSTGKVGLMTLKGREQIVIPAQGRMLLEGYAKINTTDECVIIEQPSTSTLPGGIFVECCLVSMPKEHPFKLPVWVRNESEHDVTLPCSCVIAELHTPATVHDNLPTSREDSNIVRCCAVSPQSASESTESGLVFDLNESPLPEEWKERITQSLTTYADVFAQHDLDFGHTSKVEHHIHLRDETPFKQKSRPIHPNDYEAVRKHLQTLLAAGVIRESESPYSSPIVVVRKKNGDIRLCIDYRKLNSLTIRDAYALPHLEESFSALAGSKWFSVMDLKSGYYQIAMNECDKLKTAFVCPLGFYEFNRMPQGITNAPSTFQRLMERCMGSLNLKEVLVFLDDVIVFSDTKEEHERRLLHVLQQLREYGLKLSPSKCRFFQSSVRYLGHIVSSKGVETNPEKVSALRTWPRPNTLTELKSFLGFAGYYRRFVKDYSRIVKPLNDLTGGYPPCRKGKKATPSSAGYLNIKEPFANRWTLACQEAFQTIIDKLTSAPVLGFANPKLPYFLHTDASTSGLGGALYQEQDGEMRVIAYASRGLSSSEKRYPAHKLEFLALKWSVVEKFHDYLYGNVFTVVTDNNPLTYILKSAKLDAASYRWLAALSTFDFNIKYRAGKSNQDADGLSRRPHDDLPDDDASLEERERIRQFASHHLSSSPEHLNLPPETVTALCSRHLVQADGNLPSVTLVESLALHADAVPDAYGEVEALGCSIIPTFSEADLQHHQRSDPVLGKVINMLESANRTNPKSITDSLELKLMLKEWKRFELKSNLLYRVRQSDGDITYQFVVPKSLRSPILSWLHEDMGHLGFDRTLDLIRTRFYWPKMAKDVENKIKSCGRCVRRKTPPEKSAPLVNIQTTRPMELVCIDYLSLEPDSKNTKDILVITDHFTKYAVALPTKDQKATTVAKCLWEQFLIHYGFPERILSDQGRDFESQLIHELCALAGIKKTRTSPYHPRANPVERFNRTLLSMLGTLREKEKSHWRDYVKPLTHAYNCTKNDVTGFSPYELMFGRRPRLPVDIAFGLPVQGGASKSHSQYVKNLKTHLEESYQIVVKNSAKVAERNKKRFDRVVRESTLQEGDHVLVRNLRLRNKHKLADKWESTVYKVLNRKGDLPVYTVQPINEDGPTRTLHRDHLLPCSNLVEDEEPEQVAPKVRRPRTRSQQSQFQSPENHSESEDDSCDCPVQLSVIPEKRFVQVLELPRGQHPPVNPAPEADCSSANSTHSEPQDVLAACDLPLPPAEADGVLPNLALVEQEVVVEQAIEPGLNRENIAIGESQSKPTGDVIDGNVIDGDVIDGNVIDGDVIDGNVIDGDVIDGDVIDTDVVDADVVETNIVDTNIVDQDQNDKGGQLTNTNIVDQEKTEKHGQLTDTDTDDPDLTTRRSERFRRPPKRFHYDELGKPLISFAKSLLESFNRALDTLGDDSYHVVHGTGHDGTHADLRREGVTSMKNQVTNSIFVI